MRKEFLVCLVLFSIPLVFASSDVSVSVVTSGNDTWTASSTEETFNFTIANDNSTFSFNIVNITVPDGFSSLNDLGVSLVDWNCMNNSTTVSCYNETDFLVQGDSISIWFNSTSFSSSDEENVKWKVFLINETTAENISVEVNSGIDGKPPQVSSLTMNYMGGDFEDGDDVSQREPITVTVQAEDNGVGIDSVWVDVYDSSDAKVQTVVLSGGSEFSGDILTDSLDFGTYSANISANDSFNNSDISVEFFSFTIIPLPDLKVGEFTLDPPNPYPDQDLTVYVDITKDGDCDGSINITWSLNGSEYEETIDCSDIDTTKEVNHIFVGFSGENNVSLMIDSGYNVYESFENNNYQSQIISTNLNVTILDVDPSHLEYDGNLILNVFVKYWNNNTNVTDLSLNNFEVYDRWTSDSPNYRNNSIRISDVDTTLSSDGIYLVNYTVPEISEEILEYGEHNVKVGINKVNYPTNSSNIEYFLDGPDLEIIFGGLNDHNMEDDGEVEISFSISVKNNGNRAINSVNLTQNSLETTFGELGEFDSCYSANEQVESGETEELCDGVEIELTSTGQFKINAIVEGDYGSIKIKYSGESGTYEIIENDDGSGDDSDGSDGNDDGWADQSSGGGGFGGTTTTVEKKYLTISEYPEKVEVEQGKRKTVNVDVKSQDDWEFQDVALKVNKITSSWITIIPAGEVEIEPLKSQKYRVVFEIPEDAEVKDYSGEFEVSSSFETKKQSFTLSVIPGSELQVTINSTIEDYQNQIQQLEDEIDSMKNKGYNTTEAEQKLQELKDEFNKLLAYRDGGNYKSAYELFDETEDLLNQTASVVSGAFTLPTQQLIGIAESRWVFSGLVTLLFAVGGYTFWGRHFKVKEKLIKKVKRKERKKPDLRGKELEDLASQIVRRKRTIKKPKIEEKVKEKPKPEISERMQELETIKNLVKGAKAN